jgi:hypothetical protein
MFNFGHKMVIINVQLLKHAILQGGCVEETVDIIKAGDKRLVVQEISRNAVA